MTDDGATLWMVFQWFDANGAPRTFKEAEVLLAAEEVASLDYCGELPSRYSWSPPDADEVGKLCGAGDFMLAKKDAFTRMRVAASTHYEEIDEEEMTSDD